MLRSYRTSRRGTRWFAVGVATTAVVGLCLGASIAGAGSKSDTVDFDLFPNTPFVSCLAQGNSTPTVHATVKRGDLNDELTLTLRGFKPGLQFDLFTVEHSPQLANGAADPNFTNFGLAWYQSDVEANHGRSGNGDVKIRTILLDQIFGFDPAVGLPPTNTFHVGFWFNNPADAAPCGFTGFTPFNGEHHAGPLAFITRPDATTGLGPLCSTPDSSNPSGCNP
jgi:hypothetical protein